MRPAVFGSQSRRREVQLRGGVAVLGPRRREREAAVLRAAGVALLSALSSVMSLLCVLLDSAEEDGYLHRSVRSLTNTHSRADCGRGSPRPASP